MGGSYTTVTNTFDLGPTGFYHSADGGTPGANVLYFTSYLENMSAGDKVFVDDFQITAVPEPATFPLLIGALVGLFMIGKRMRLAVQEKS